MTLDEMNQNDSVQNSYELCQEADRILEDAGLDIWGRDKTRDNYRQARFERSMITGAYRNNSDRNR